MTFLGRIVAVIQNQDRLRAAKDLAAEMGCDDLLLFVRDPELCLYLPAPGFPQTLPEGRAWRDFIAECILSNGQKVSADLCWPGLNEHSTVWGEKAGEVILATQGREPDATKWKTVLELLPVFETVLRSEYAARLATASAAIANETARQARSLADALSSLRIQLEAALRESKLNAEEREKAHVALRNSEKLAAVGRLAATMAHEINNPLEAVTNILYLLKKDCTLSEESRQQLRIADQELDRVAHIAKQTLGFYRDNSAPKLMNPAEAIDELLTVYSYRFRNRDISVEKELDETAVGFAAPGEFRQVFSNLFVNAVDAVSQGNGRIRVRLRKARDWRDGVRRGICITIGDNGYGIPHAQLKKIFDPFYTTKEEVGTGLGLWLSQNIVQKHNGRIRVRSSVHPRRAGTVFSVFWPSNSESVTSNVSQTA